MDTTDAAFYAENSSLQSVHVHQIMAQYLQWEREDSVLDVGCGTGRTTQYIAQLGVKSVVGIDLSPDFIRYTKENAQNRNLSFCVADVQYSSELEPAWRQSFDKAVSLYVLHLIKDKASALENISACLKPGGQLFMIVPTDDNVLMVTTRLMSSHHRWGKYLAGCPRMMPWSVDDREGLRGLAKDSGFEVLSCDCPLLRHWYGSEEDTISAMLPFLGLRYIPEEEQADFLSDWWASARSMTDASGCSVRIDQAGRVEWTFRVLIIHARKF
ncbi:ubiquinone/menaquinone biosynthesis C-methyltransferase UbiE-like [Branchiostoma lanceolatum]|uniref:ubiquinone/menaquinone biosynthesis C-methyltransferase UbiE-like n=1 Tax=Branchiostoma lanceolatum TaxID=7740 RepID=UPI00345257FF